MLHSPQIFKLSNLYKQKSGKHVLKCILRVWDNSGRNKIPYEVEFINMGSLSRNSVLNDADWEVRKGVNSFFGWLAETWTKWWPSEQAGNAGHV